MHTTVSSRAAELQACRVRLARGPAAAAEARGQVRAAIAVWNAPVDEDVAVLLTSELVTNAVKHAKGRLSCSASVMAAIGSASMSTTCHPRRRC